MWRSSMRSCWIWWDWETSRLPNARGGSVSGSVSGAGADPSGRGTRDGGSVKPSAQGSLYPSLVPRAPSPSSQDPIHQRAQKHDDTDDPIRREKRGVELRQVSRLHLTMLPPDHDDREHHAG